MLHQGQLMPRRLTFSTKADKLCKIICAYYSLTEKSTGQGAVLLHAFDIYQTGIYRMGLFL